MRGPARIATYLGRILMVLGFAMILIAWNGAASLDYIQGQFPFLLSGAMPGLAFIIVGAGLEFIQANRQATAKRAKQMNELNLAVLKLVGHVRESGSIPVRTPGAPEAGLAGSAAPAGAATAAVGAAGAPAATGAVATAERPADAGAKIVVAGRSSFHDTTCHLVAGRDDMAVISRLEAEGQGLSACKVCKP
jgi:hypothetical protein